MILEGKELQAAVISVQLQLYFQGEVIIGGSSAFVTENRSAIYTFLSL